MIQKGSPSRLRGREPLKVVIQISVPDSMENRAGKKKGKTRKTSRRQATVNC